MATYGIDNVRGGSEGSAAALDECEEGGWKALVLPAGGEFQDEAQGVGFEGVRGNL